MNQSVKTFDAVRKYYGKVLKGAKDLKSNACCSTESIPETQRSILAQIDDEILDRFYGCGSPIPPALDGCTVLDLGCGSGRDVYLASSLVGPGGFVIGVDMTEEQLAVARRHQESQAERFGFSKSNVDFRQGYIEDLSALGIADDSVDVVISNCVINLSPDKERVFSEILRVLKPGGELYFSDVFAGRRVPAELRDDPLLLGECLGGALYIEDFRRMLRNLGCLDYRVISKSAITIGNPEIVAKTGTIDFYSMTIRIFKLAALEDICEDYGQVAVYKGTIPTVFPWMTIIPLLPASRCWFAATAPPWWENPALAGTFPFSATVRFISGHSPADLRRPEIPLTVRVPAVHAAEALPADCEMPNWFSTAAFCGNRCI